MRSTTAIGGLALLALGVGLLAWGARDDAAEAGEAALPEPRAAVPGATDAAPGLRGPALGDAPGGPAEVRDPVAAAPAVAPASEVVRLLVRTQPSMSSEEAGRVPGLRFELGLARGVPAFGDDAPPGEALLAGRTDERGEAEVLLPRERVDELARDGAVSVWGRVLEPGWQRRLGRKRLVDDEGARADEPVLALLARAGGTLEGTLLGRDGAPSAGSVRVERDGEDAWVGSDRDNARADGRWALHVAESGRYRLRAAGAHTGRSPVDARGTAELSPLELDLADLPRDVVLQLVGPGRIHGRVLDGGGRPAAGLDVLALAARADVGQGSFVVPREISSAYERAGAGHFWMTDTTDAEGRFDLDGLCDDLFVVRARTEEHGGYPILLTPRPVASVGAPLELRLSRPHVAVLLEDAQGARAELALVDGRGFREGFLSEWPDAPHVFVAPSPDGAASASSWDLLLPGKVVARGEATFEAGDDADYLAVLLAPDEPPSIRPVHVEPGAGRVEVRFRLAGPRPKGALVVDVVAPDGAPVQDELSVRVVDPLTRLCVLERDRWYAREGEELWPTRLELPAGEYELRVASIPFVDTHHGTLMRPREHGDYRRRVSIRAGGEERLTARLSPPAFLTVELRGELSEADVDALQERWPDYEREELSGWAADARLRLLAEGEYPTPVEFARFAMAGTSAAGTHLSDQLRLGSTETSQALPPGSYVLEARLPGGREVRREVVLVGGETLALTLELGAAR